MFGFLSGFDEFKANSIWLLIFEGDVYVCLSVPEGTTKSLNDGGAAARRRFEIKRYLASFTCKSFWLPSANLKLHTLQRSRVMQQ